MCRNGERIRVKRGYVGEGYCGIVGSVHEGDEYLKTVWKASHTICIGERGPWLREGEYEVIKEETGTKK